VEILGVLLLVVFVADGVAVAAATLAWLGGSVAGSSSFSLNSLVIAFPLKTSAHHFSF